MRLALVLALLLVAAAPARAAQSGSSEIEHLELDPLAADEIAERTGQAALVVVAQPVKVWDRGLAECRIISVLKGGFKGRARTFQVKFGKVLGGSWPQKGVVAVYFLRPPIGGRTKIFSRKTVFEHA